MQKIVILGTCGSGKTWLGKRLASKLGFACTDMDELFWLPGWQKRPFDAFEKLIDQTTSGEQWIVCGNYSKLQHLTVGKADTVIWLDLPLGVLLWRIVSRSLIQYFSKATICNGNRQTWGQFWWLFKHLFKSYWSKKRRYRQMQTPAINWIHLTGSAQVSHWLDALE